MCLAIPGKLISVTEHEDLLFREGKVSFEGILKDVNLSLLPEAKAGDYVLVHVGIAIAVVNETEAKLMISYLGNTSESVNDLIT